MGLTGLMSMSRLLFAVINGPLLFFNIIVNMFYAKCLIFPPRNKHRLKQPLILLLGFLVFCTLMYCVSLLTLAFLSWNSQQNMRLPYLFVLYYVDHSMTCYVWLNFYYYIQIVPLQRAPLIWVKRNIKSVIYTFLALDMTVYLASRGKNILEMIVFKSVDHPINTTFSEGNLRLTASEGTFRLFVNMYILICLCVSVLSSFSTVCYLHKHMKSVAQSGSSFSGVNLHSQMRVTITGICQGVLYLAYGVFYLSTSIGKIGGKLNISSMVSFTVTSLYISGTTATLGVGQAVFRERISSIWKALKALKSLR